MSIRVFFFYFLLLVLPVQAGKLESDILSRVVHIVSRNTNRSLHGTGFWLDSEYILTAQHVISGAQHIGVLSDSSSDVGRDAKIVVSNKKYDFAILKPEDTSSFLPIPMSASTPPVGTSVWFWTTHDQFKNIRSQRVPIFNAGSIVADDVSVDGNREFLVSGLVLAGGSGSSIFDQTGNLVGIATGDNADNEGTESYISCTHIQPIKDAYLKLLSK